jgi:hypothetical protein
MSRAHVQGYDSNAEQFARMGNPWVTERERAEFSAPNKKERRQNRNGGKPKLGNFPTPERKPERSSRAESEAMAGCLRSRRFLSAFKSGLPGGTLTVAPVVPETKCWEISQHPARTPVRLLSSAERALAARQRDDREAKRAAAEAAYLAGEAHREAEKRRLLAQIAALEEQLARI